MGSVGGRDNVLVLLASEDIDGNEVALGMAVLPRLRGRHRAHLNRDHN